MTIFTEKVIALIQSIPAGKIMTYGQIAGYAGSPRGARQVVRILHTMSKKHRLPWHRVINSKGEISILQSEAYEMQVFLLQSEGIEVINDRYVSLEKYQFHLG
jgi:methylated-DNA-protein-cysteine methyltransferase-like protein